MKRTFQYAYATVIQSKAMYYAALVWAQALRNTGTVHDLVLLLDVKSGLKKDNETLTDHFDVVKEVGETSKRRRKSVGKLSAWQLREYERVVYIDLNLLCLSNLDYLFALPEPAAAPLTSHPQEFHTGLLVLQPSDNTFTELLKRMESVSKADRRVEHRLLNGFFHEWFQMAAKHRLPMRLNMPVHLSSKPNASAAAFPTVLQYPKKELASMLSIWTKQEDLNQTSELPHQTGEFAVWLEVLAALRRNKYQPLDDETVSHFSRKPSNGSASTWPPNPNPHETLASKPLHVPPRQAFATVLTSADHLPAVAGWTMTHARFHLSTPDHESLLLVHSSIDRQTWQPLETFFDSIVVVDGSNLTNVDGSNLTTPTVLLHLWNQTSYDKLVYVDPSAVFLSNCDFLMELEPFAAAADYILPDTFSLQVMVIQPDNERFLELSRSFLSVAPSEEFSMVRFVNEHHSHWYPSSVKHRIGPIFNAESDLQRRLEVDGLSWRILCLYSRALLDPAAETAAIWRKYVCRDMQTRAVDLLNKHLGLCNLQP
jgi:hypothetical protein